MFRPYISPAVPFYTSPSLSAAYVALCYRNFQSKSSDYSHVGLGINCVNTAKMLRAQNIRCDVFPVWTYQDVISVITKNPTITHLVLEAPFIPNGQITSIVNSYPNIEFTCRCHSQVAFLQCEAQAIQLIRQYIVLQDTSLNFKLSVNSERLGNFLEQAYGSSILWLPNLYFTDITQSRAWAAPGKLIKLGSFGSIRLLKNHITAGAAALMLAAMYRRDLQFYLSVSREEHGKGVLQSIINMFANVPYATLVQVPWTNWSNFKNIIANLDLHMQLSMTETFNITSADAARGGVPTVASEAIDWVPDNWYANIDDVASVASVGWNLLNSPHAGADGIAHLNQFNAMSISKWIQWLNGDAKTMKSVHLH